MMFLKQAHQWFEPLVHTSLFSNVLQHCQVGEDVYAVGAFQQ